MKHPPSIPWSAAVLGGLAAAAITCRAPTATLADLGARVSSARPDPAATLIHEYWSGFRTASRFLVTDDVSWHVAWQRAYSTITPVPPLPAVDFLREVVLVAALGERSTGGFDVRIDSVVTHAGGIAVYTTAVAPGSSCATTTSLTQPVHAVRWPRPQGPVVFDERRIVSECR